METKRNQWGMPYMDTFIENMKNQNTRSSGAERRYKAALTRLAAEKRLEEESLLQTIRQKDADILMLEILLFVICAAFTYSVAYGF